MKIELAQGVCDGRGPRVMRLFQELSDVEAICIDEAQKDPSYAIEEAVLQCPGRSPDGSCGLVSRFPCLKAIIDDCIPSELQ